METHNWGQMQYAHAWAKQKELVCRRISGDVSDQLIFCSHYPVVTMGRKAQKSDIHSWTGPVYRIERGGQATYHGPGQIVVYPIISLRDKGHNIGGLLNALKLATIMALDSCGISATDSSHREGNNLSGVWVGDKKVASIGLAVRRWVTYHGMAINLYTDPQAFSGISPCGMHKADMVSVEELVEGIVSRSELEATLGRYLAKHIMALSV